MSQDVAEKVAMKVPLFNTLFPDAQSLSKLKVKRSLDVLEFVQNKKGRSFSESKNAETNDTSETSPRE